MKEFDSMVFSIRLTVQEKKIVESYVRMHSISLGEAFKQALFEKIEDEYDITVCEEALKEYEASGRKSRPIEELWQELGIRDTEFKQHQNSKKNFKSSINIQWK